MPLPCPVATTRELRAAGVPGLRGAALPQRPGLPGFLLVARLQDAEEGSFLSKALSGCGRPLAGGFSAAGSS